MSSQNESLSWYGVHKGHYYVKLVPSDSHPHRPYHPSINPSVRPLRPIIRTTADCRDTSSIHLGDDIHPCRGTSSIVMGTRWEHRLPENLEWSPPPNPRRELNLKALGASDAAIGASHTTPGIAPRRESRNERPLP